MRDAGPRVNTRELWRGVADGFGRHRLLTYASAMSYQLISALVPLLCFALALLGLFHAQSLWTDHLRGEIYDHVSVDVFGVLDSTVTTVIAKRQVYWVTIGLAITLWEFSGATRATMEALDGIHRVRRKRRARERYAVSVGLAAAEGTLLLAAIAVVTLGHLLLGGFGSFVLRYLLAGALLTLAVGLTLRFAPATRQPVAWLSAGSVLIVVGWLVVVGGYVFYASHVASYASVFGALSIVFVLVVAIYLAAVVFLVGVLVDRCARDAAEQD